MTDATDRAYATLVRCHERGGQDGWVSAGQFARAHWPDSPAWDRTTNRRDGKSGAYGGTMPMLGARMLYRLVAEGRARTRTTPHHQTLWLPLNDRND